MKLQTHIPARRSGTVSVIGQDKQNYVFAADAEGVLVCDVQCEVTVAHLLATGNFEPVSADDYDRAIAISKSIEPTTTDLDGDDDEFESDPNALPLEANTPPAPRKGRKASAH